MPHNKKHESNDPENPNAVKQHYYVGREEIHFKEDLHGLSEGISKEYHHLVEGTKEWTAKHGHHSSGDHSEHHKKEKSKSKSPRASAELEHHHEGLEKVTEEPKAASKQESKIV